MIATNFCSNGTKHASKTEAVLQDFMQLPTYFIFMIYVSIYARLNYYKFEKL